eukprot:CAMPEP_0119017134 /NCGR_PEP_ID=MMETSP1176-20130426/15508_1 /TAXON_ID=265551 /ORGANISM="Synedropsis recta cf, Strain CCMP1620" /LENGTH=45 /DNA_ID= /DNA_START= /DNA_END= /DNA_ORIENTATION=
MAPSAGMDCRDDDDAAAAADDDDVVVVDCCCCDLDLKPVNVQFGG